MIQVRFLAEGKDDKDENVDNRPGQLRSFRQSDRKKSGPDVHVENVSNRKSVLESDRSKSVQSKHLGNSLTKHPSTQIVLVPTLDLSQA